MPQSESELTTAELRRENRRLREAVKCLCDCLEADQNSPTPEKAREALARVEQQDGITPPWERESYESKQDWLEAKRGGQ